MKPTTRTSIILTAAFCLLILTGCDNLTRERFNMIRVNSDTSSDVQHLIGEPTNRLATQWHYQRMEKHLEVLIDFNEADVVIRKQWIDAMANEWYDSDKSARQPSMESTTIRQYQ